MKTRSKKYFLVLGLLVLLAAAFTLKTFYDAGEFKQIVPRPLGSSVAAPFEWHLLIGSVFDGRFLLCRLPAG